MNNHFFSIVIPTYNRASYVKKTVESLLQQRYDQFEIIVVDDGSSDNTEEIISAIESYKVHYYKKENAERGAARNYGARLAKGTYINFFDSDDLAYPNHLMEANNAINYFYQPEVLHLGYDIKDVNGIMIKKVDYLPQTINESLIDGNHLSCNGVFLRKDIAWQSPFSENRLLSASEDYALWLRLASRYDFYCWNVITSTIVNHDQRSVLNIKHDEFLLRMEALKDELLADPFFQKRYKKKWNKFRAYQDVLISLHLAMAKYDKRVSLSYLWSAITFRPFIILTRRFLAALKNILL